MNCDCFVGRAGTRSSNSTGQPSRGKSFAAPFYAFRAALHPSVNTVGGKKSHDFGRILTLLPLDLKFPICLWSAAACCRFAVARLVASCIQQSKWETQHGKPRCPQRQQAAALHSAGKPAHKFCNRRVAGEQRQDVPSNLLLLPRPFVVILRTSGRMVITPQSDPTDQSEGGNAASPNRRRRKIIKPYALMDKIPAPVKNKNKHTVFLLTANIRFVNNHSGFLSVQNVCFY